MDSNKPIQLAAYGIFQAQVEKERLRGKCLLTMPNGSMNKIDLPSPDRFDRSAIEDQARP